MQTKFEKLWEEKNRNNQRRRRVYRIMFGQQNIYKSTLDEKNQWIDSNKRGKKKSCTHSLKTISDFQFESWIEKK